MPDSDADLYPYGYVPLLLGLTRYVEKDYSPEILWGMAIVLLAGFVYLLFTPRSTERLIAFLAASLLPLVTSFGLALDWYNTMYEHLGYGGMADPAGRYPGLWQMALMVRLGAGVTAAALLATAVLAWLPGKKGSVEASKSGQE